MDFEFVTPCWSVLLFLGVHEFWEWAQVNFKIANNMFNKSGGGWGSQMNKEKTAWELYDVYTLSLSNGRWGRWWSIVFVAASSVCLSLSLSLLHHHFKFRNHSSLSSPPAPSQSATTNKQPYSSTAALTNRLLAFESLAQLKRGSVTHTRTHARMHAQSVWWVSRNSAGWSSSSSRKKMIL